MKKIMGLVQGKPKNIKERKAVEQCNKNTLLMSSDSNRLKADIKKNKMKKYLGVESQIKIYDKTI